MDDIATTGNSLNGRWLVCSPELLSKNWAWHGFSATGYYFAKEIRKTIRVPVGMIGSYKGGIPAQAWISLPGLQQDTLFSHYNLYIPRGCKKGILRRTGGINPGSISLVDTVNS